MPRIKRSRGLAPLLLCAGLFSFASQAAAQFRTADPSILSADEPRPQLTVRQGGGGDQDGLLKQMKGPAALWSLAGGGEHMSAIAGTMQAKGGERRYLALRNSLPLAGGTAQLTYAGDDRDGSAIEARFSHPAGPVNFSLSQTFSWGFDSAWTGTGASRAAQITEAWINAAPAAVPIGIGLRETFRRDGAQATELRTYQMMTLDAVTVMNVTATPFGLAAATSGSLMAMGQFRGTSYVAELDYGDGRSWRPSAARFSLDRPLGRGWDLYAEADQPLPRGAGSVDVGATRQLAGFLVGPFATIGASSSIFGIRLWLPLDAIERPHGWLGPYYGGPSVGARR